jgi:hypothetical protein
MAYRIQLLNRRIGSLIVVERFAPSGGIKHAIWKCICDCGIVKMLPTSELTRKGRRAKKSCGCLYFYSSKEERLINDVYNHMKYRHRKITDLPLLALDIFKDMIKNNCYYCGCSPSNSYRNYSKDKDVLKYNGIDRINSELGYIEGNVRTCCINCNVAKSDLTELQFAEHTRKLYNHFVLPRQTESVA